MVDEPEVERLEEGQEEEEGGPVKSFLEHLEDLRWVLIKSIVALGVTMLVCLIAGNHVVNILKRPLEKARIPGSAKQTQFVTVLFGTNELINMRLPFEQAAAYNLGTNGFAAVRVEPATVGTNQVVTWRLEHNPELERRAQKLHVEGQPREAST